MRRYETIVIVDSDLAENDRASLFDRIKEIIPQQQGILLKEDLWGVKKLAYEIKKKPRGFYARFDYCGKGAVVDELERFFRIDDRVLKYLTVQLDADADVEKIQAEIAALETGAGQQTSAGNEAATTGESASSEDSATPAEAEAGETVTETSEKE